MKNHILMYNTSDRESKVWLETIKALRSDNYFFTILNHQGSGDRNGRPFLPKQAGRTVLSLPMWYFLGACNFLGRTLFSSTRTVMLLQWPEKIVISPIARIFGWRVLWLELPDNTKPASRLHLWLYQSIAQTAEIIVFDGQRADEWQRLRKPPVKVTRISPPLYPRAARQSDLFQALADRPRRARFVIGTTIHNLEISLIEPLLSALQHALAVCPTLELLIIGEGENRKRLIWLIRKMGLGNNVWLAGETFDLLHHLEHIDVYVMSKSQASLEDISMAILVLQHGIPVISQRGNGCEAIITPEIGACIDICDSEALAVEFLRFEQVEDVKKRVGKLARSQAHLFTFENLVSSLKSILDIPPQTLSKQL